MPVRATSCRRRSCLEWAAVSSRCWRQPSPTLAKGGRPPRLRAHTTRPCSGLDRAAEAGATAPSSLPRERRRAAGEDGGRPPSVSSPGASGSRSASRGPPARILRLPQPLAAGGWGAEWTRGHPLGARGRWPRQRKTCRSRGSTRPRSPPGEVTVSLCFAARLSSCLVHALPRLWRVCLSPLLSPSPIGHSILPTLRGFTSSRICKPPVFRGASHPPHTSTSPCPSVLKRFVPSFIFCRTPDLSTLHKPPQPWLGPGKPWIPLTPGT